MGLPITSWSEPITEPDILASIKALPTEDELPCDDGEPMETPRHREQMNVLIESLKAHWSDRRGYYVGGNMFVHYDPANKRRSRGPDFFLVLDVDDRERKSWVVWFEGMRFPDLIIELLSDSTRAEDKGVKQRLYERLFHTTEYYLYDPFSQEFLGYSLQSGTYHELAFDPAGRLYSAVTGLSLGIHAGWLRWWTAEGELIATPLELAAQARQQAESARQRADEERQRADAERQRADEERQRAEQAEELLEAYRRRFGELA